MKMTMKLEGMDDLRRKIRNTERKLRTKGLIRAAQAGADEVADRAEQLAPKRRGKLARRIKTAVTEKRDDYVEVSVSHHPDDFHGLFQELGVKPHSRFYGSKKKAKKMGRRGRGQHAYDPRPRKPHPGHKAQPHLRPAFDERKRQAENAAAQELKDVFR